MAEVLMPKATAVWLIDNTTLSFDQIAKFCNLHHLEVKGIADGDVAENMRGVDPIAGGMLTREEIRRCEANPALQLRLQKSKIDHIPQPKRKGARYTPVTRRADKPNAVAWFIRNHPEVTDPQICKLIGTTKATITKVRDRTHHDTINIKPVDPVTLGLCSQIELDEIIANAADKRRRMDDERAQREEGPGLKPVDVPHVEEEEDAPASDLSAADVFRNFTG